MPGNRKWVAAVVAAWIVGTCTLQQRHATCSLACSLGLHPSKDFFFLLAAQWSGGIP